ncbi:MAG: molybdopterin cofactor-binding domain-containing protein [Novosphingobium sp.]
MELTRRGLLIGAAVGGGLLVAFGLRSPHYAPPLEPGKGEYAFGAWIKIGTDGVVTVAVPQLEMGQGVTTVLPQVVAMELGADWRQVAVEPAPVSGVYANIPLSARWAPLWLPVISGLGDEPDDWLARRFAQARRFIATADGMSLAAYEQPCREAAANARALLAMAAADRWNVAWEECQAQGGFIRHGEKRASFAELAAEAADYSPPDPPPLLSEAPAEKPGAFVSEAAGPIDAETLLDFPRLDLPAKVDGTYLFAGDVRLPDMVFAAIRHGPLAQAELTGFDKAAVAGMPGLLGIVRGKRWLAAVATNWWAAEKAASAMVPEFRVTGVVSTARIEERLDRAVRSADPHRIVTRGDGGAEMEKPDVAIRYDIAPAFHGTLETASATARFQDGRLELWLASQAPEQARRAAAAALEIDETDVVLYPMPAGGSFDRRLEHDHAIEAALIAREVGKPVQLIWSRWQEHLASRPRAPAAAVLSAQTARDGAIRTFRARFAVPATGREFGYRLFDNATAWSAVESSAGKADPMAVEGADPSYSIPNVAIDHVPVDIGLPTGRMRANAHGYTAFCVESFIDEVAYRNKREPLSFRMEMLGGDLRLAACLQRAARLAQWDGGKEQSGQGLACHRMGGVEQGGCIAAIATANRAEGGVRVERIVAVADIGRIVNLDIARQQIEGGLVFGLGLALGASPIYEKGLPDKVRLGSLALPALADCPQIDVQFIPSEADPFDPGELGVAVAAPAIANALFSATGLRLRRLPLLSEGL